MLEIKANLYIVKAKIITMKVVNKEGKFWVVFNTGKQDGAEQSVFSDAFASEADAKAFLMACGSSL
jgi:hypothetical protein